LAWRAPPDVELGLIGRAALAAGLSWWLADLVAEGTTPLLAVFTALVVMQATTRATLRMAITRTLGVAVGIFLGVVLGDVIPLTAVTVAVVVAVALVVADFAMRLPLAAARQVPMAMVLVLAATTADGAGSIWSRAAQTALGAATGAAVMLVLPVSRVGDLRRLLATRARRLSAVWEAIGAGLATPWSPEDAATWRRDVRAAVAAGGAADEVVVARDAARWSHRRRRDRATLDVLAAWRDWLDTTAASVVRLAEDLERAAANPMQPRPAWPTAATLSTAVGAAIAASVAQAAAPAADDPVDGALRRAAVTAGPVVAGAGQTRAVDERTVASDIDRLVQRLRPTPIVVTRAASPSPR
jgi:hypothetical protein